MKKINRKTKVPFQGVNDAIRETFDRDVCQRVGHLVDWDTVRVVRFLDLSIRDKVRGQ